MKKQTVSLGIGLVVLLSTFSGCGSTSSDDSSKVVKIDKAEYYEKTNSVRNMVAIKYIGDNQEREEKYYEEKVVVNNNVITYEVNNTVETIVTINAEDINLTYPKNPSLNTTEKRNVTVGEQTVHTLSSTSRTINGSVVKSTKEVQCIVESKLNEFVGDPKFWKEKYEGDILFERCTTTMETYVSDENKTYYLTDIQHVYSKKEIGQIALVNRDCYIETGEKNENGQKLYDMNDTSTQCDVELTRTSLLLK